MVFERQLGMALTESDRSRISSWQTSLKHLRPWRFLQNRRPESEIMAEFLQSCRELLPQVPIITEDIPETELPGLIPGENWRLHAVPEGRKLDLLEEILLALDGQGAAMPPAVQGRWEKLPVPPELTVFIAPQCPFCPQMVRQLIPLTVIPPRAEITLIDASLFTELARRYEIKAVPTVIVNGVYRLTGAFPLAELLDLAEKTDPAQLPVSVWERLMQEGQAGMLGELILQKELVFPQVLQLLIHPEINIRLGAMVALETVGEEKPELIASSLPDLWEKYAGSELAVQGDIIYLIGEWGDGSWRRPLEAAMAAASRPELREALEEALEKLREKGE